MVAEVKLDSNRVVADRVVSTTCPYCGGLQHVDESRAGREVYCESCGAKYRVPTATETPTPAPTDTPTPERTPLPVKTDPPTR